MPKPLLLVITGPTASGKTATSIAVATNFNCPIISFDSRQCYRELNIGVARPSQEQLQQVQHYFIASHSIHQPIDAAYYEQWAIHKLEELFAKHPIVVAVGGTGLYLKALLEGLDEIPPVPANTRQWVRDNFIIQGMPWLQLQLQNNDPIYAAQGEMQNPHRMMRALEIQLATGQSILTFRTAAKKQRNFQALQFGISIEKTQLTKNIEDRTNHMMLQGLVDEVKELLPQRQLTALQTVGYTEIFAYLNGDIDLQNAVIQIKTHTRQYAKRQMTWFNKKQDINWIGPNNYQKIIDEANATMQNL